MITTIAVVAAIAEKKKSYLGDRCHCDRYDRWKVVSMRSLNFFFSVIAATTAIVAIIWKPGLMGCVYI